MFVFVWKTRIYLDTDTHSIEEILKNVISSGAFLNSGLVLLVSVIPWLGRRCHFGDHGSDHSTEPRSQPTANTSYKSCKTAPRYFKIKPGAHFLRKKQQHCFGATCALVCSFFRKQYKLRFVYHAGFYAVLSICILQQGEFPFVSKLFVIMENSPWTPY